MMQWKQKQPRRLSEIKGDQVIQFVTFLSPNVGGHVASPLKKVTFSLTIPKKVTLFESPGEAYLFVGLFWVEGEGVSEDGGVDLTWF